MSIKTAFNRLAYSRDALTQQLVALVECGSYAEGHHTKAELNRIRRLIKSGADITARGKYGWTLPMLAAHGGHAAALKVLLEYATPGLVNAVNDNNCSAAMLCAHHENNTCLKLLVAAGADMDLQSTDDGHTALMIALRNGQSDNVHVILSGKPDLSICDNNYMCPLSQVCVSTHPKIVPLATALAAALIDAGAVVDSPGYESKRPPPLFWAARQVDEKTSEKLMDLLVRRGADIAASDEYGNTPLHSAAVTDDTTACRRLIALGLDPLRINGQGQTPEMLARDVDAWTTASYLNNLAREMSAQEHAQNAASAAYIESSLKNGVPIDTTVQTAARITVRKNKP